MAPSSSRPPGGSGEPLLLVHKIKLDPAVYRTDIPLIVHERCREPGPCHDGTIPEPPKLLALWRALRWLMAAFPDRRGFGQRAMSEVAGIDQKSVQKWARKLLELGLFVEVGREVYPHLRGQGKKPGKGKPKVQPIYSIPLDELEAESVRQAWEILRAWERRLFGAEPQPPPPSEAQLALDLSDPSTDQTDPPTDQSLDPSTDQTDPLKDQSLDPSTDQTDPPTDQGLDPLTDQTSDPLTDHMEGGREEGREALDALTREGPDSRTASPPAGQEPLPLPPFELWAMFAPSVSPVADRILLGRLAADHDEPTGGHGWYWVGRAILAAGLRKDVKDWLGFVRRLLDRWRTSGTYGSELPPAERPPRALRLPATNQVRAVGDKPAGSAGEKVSDLEILLHPGLDNHERTRWLTRFRNAPPDDKPAVLERFRKEHPRDDTAPAEQAAAD